MQNLPSIATLALILTSYQAFAGMAFLDPSQVLGSQTSERLPFVDDNSTDAYLLLFLEACQNRAIGEPWHTQYYPRYGVQVRTPWFSNQLHEQVFGTSKDGGIVVDPKTENRSIRGTPAEIRSVPLHSMPIPVQPNDTLNLLVAASSIRSDKKGLLEDGMEQLPASMALIGPEGLAVSSAISQIYRTTAPLVATIFRLNDDATHAQGEQGFTVPFKKESYTANELTTGALLVYEPKVDQFLQSRRLVPSNELPEARRWTVSENGRLQYSGTTIPQKTGMAYVVIRFERLDTILHDTDKVTNRAYLTSISRSDRDAARIKCYDSRHKIAEQCMRSYQTWLSLYDGLRSIQSEYDHAIEWINEQGLLSASDKERLIKSYKTIVINGIATMIKTRHADHFIQRLNVSENRDIAEECLSLYLTTELLKQSPSPSFWHSVDNALQSLATN